MLSIDFAAPMLPGDPALNREGPPLQTADSLDEEVCRWWRSCAARLYKAIPDLAGLLVKADSEHRPGPNTYGRSHA